MIRAGAALAALAAGAMGLAFTAAGDPAIASAQGPGDPLFRLLGSAKEALGDLVLLKADTYLHKGLRSDVLELYEGGEDVDHEDHDHDREKTVVARDWAGKIYAETHVTDLKHIKGKEARELIPILDFSLRMNPRNVDAVLAAAYWLDQEVGDSQGALALVERGARDNPRSWEIELEAGRLSAEAGRYDSAARHYESAIRKMENGQHEPFDPIRARYGLALSLEKLSRPDEALRFYREALRFYPDRQDTALKKLIEERVRELGGA